MPRRKRREGFDYFVDKYENIYQEDFSDDYYNEEDYVPNDRFQRKNRYTGEIYRPQHINTSTIYTPQNQGTLEFSALPGYGGLDGDSRPLGDQTMMISSANPNPYIKQMTQVTQEIDTRFNKLDEAIGELAKKVDEVTGLINTSTLDLNNQQTSNKVETTKKPESLPQIQQQPQTQVVSQQQVPANSTIQRAPLRTQQHVLPKTSTTVVKPKPKKKKISKGVLIGGIIGIIVAVGLIVVGVLMIVGVISF